MVQRFDLAPVLCGINGMVVVGRGAFHASAWPCTPCARPFYILLCFTSVHPTLCCGAPCMYSICMRRILCAALLCAHGPARGVCVCPACVWCSPISKACPLPTQTHTHLHSDNAIRQERDIMIAAKCAN